MFVKENNLNILLISPNPNSIGGIASWTSSYIKFCDSNKINYQLIDSSKKNYFKKFSLVNEVIRTIKIYTQLNKSIRNQEYNIAHINLSIGNFGIFRDFMIAKLIKKNNIPIVLHFHCDIPYWDTNSLKNCFLHKILNISNCVIVLCDSSREYLLKKYKTNSIIIPNFINISEINSIKVINEDIKTILYVGRVSKEKGIIEIFEIARKFPDKKFILIGKIMIDTTKYEIPTNILMIGEKSRSEVQKYMLNSDIFILPSHSEGFSIALLEAMAVGLPCIATNVGANGDMLSNLTGIVVSKGNVSEMKCAIEKLEDQKIRKIISNNSINKVRKEYEIDSVLTNIISLYNKII